MLAERKVLLPYTPRAAFRPFHKRTQRWGCLVAHRRAGKTVAAINDLIKRALACQDRVPLFGYIAPFRSQAKSVAWDYLKHYAKGVTRKVNESELILTTVTNAEIRLFGQDNCTALRGLGFNGLLLDEYGDFAPSVWGSVIRPTLSDKQGWCVFLGTPKGHNQFYEVYDNAQSFPDEWFCLRLKASQSGILPQSELDALRRQLSEDQYLQEMETSFEAAILGAYYGTEMRQLEEAGRFCEVKYDPALPTFTAWDIGYTDDTSIFWFQVFRKEIRFIDFFSAAGMDPERLKRLVAEKPYHYAMHWLPHDAKAKTLTSGGRSLVEQLANGENGLGLSNMAIVPNLSVQDGIQAVRTMLPNCWFDAVKCKEGIEALRNYEREYDEDRKAFKEKPKHTWASHPSDAMRMAAISWREQEPRKRPQSEPVLLVGPRNTTTLEDMWAANRRQQRTYRI